MKYGPQVLSKICPTDADKSEAAAPALRQLIMLEATNTGVERDAGWNLKLKSVMHGLGATETVDNRMRVLTEGPKLEAAKNSSSFDPLLYEAAQEFLRAKPRHSLDSTTAQTTRSPFGSAQGSIVQSSLQHSSWTFG